MQAISLLGGVHVSGVPLTTTHLEVNTPNFVTVFKDDPEALKYCIDQMTEMYDAMVYTKPEPEPEPEVHYVATRGTGGIQLARSLV